MVDFAYWYSLPAIEMAVDSPHKFVGRSFSHKNYSFKRLGISLVNNKKRLCYVAIFATVFVPFAIACFATVGIGKATSVVRLRSKDLNVLAIGS